MSFTMGRGLFGSIYTHLMGGPDKTHQQFIETSTELGFPSVRFLAGGFSETDPRYSLGNPEEDFLDGDSGPRGLPEALAAANAYQGRFTVIVPTARYAQSILFNQDTEDESLFESDSSIISPWNENLLSDLTQMNKEEAISWLKENGGEGEANLINGLSFIHDHSDGLSDLIVEIGNEFHLQPEFVSDPSIYGTITNSLLYAARLYQHLEPGHNFKIAVQMGHTTFGNQGPEVWQFDANRQILDEIDPTNLSAIKYLVTHPLFSSAESWDQVREYGLTYSERLDRILSDWNNALQSVDSTKEYEIYASAVNPSADIIRSYHSVEDVEDIIERGAYGEDGISSAIKTMQNLVEHGVSQADYWGLDTSVSSFLTGWYDIENATGCGLFSPKAAALRLMSDTAQKGAVVQWGNALSDGPLDGADLAILGHDYLSIFLSSRSSIDKLPTLNNLQLNYLSVTGIRVAEESHLIGASKFSHDELFWSKVDDKLEAKIVSSASLEHRTGSETFLSISQDEEALNFTSEAMDGFSLIRVDIPSSYISSQILTNTFYSGHEFSISQDVHPILHSDLSDREIELSGFHDGLGGNDYLAGGTGDEILFGRIGNDTLIGASGEDHVDGGSGNDLLRGGKGNDTISSGSGKNTVWGGAGDDSILLDGRGDFTHSGSGNDKVVSNGSSASINLGSGNDMATVSGANSNVIGGAGDDKIDVVGQHSSGEGASIAGWSGNDRISGGRGNDFLDGNRGDDFISGGVGDDVISGGSGNDEVHGGRWSDIISGDDGADKIFGDEGKDILSGGDGDDEIEGGKGDDHIDGGSGDDTLLGGGGDDHISGGRWSDILRGESGNDYLIGGRGNDQLFGGDGNDIIRFGRGSDWADGGAGRDTFVLEQGDGLNVISNFELDIDRVVTVDTHGVETDVQKSQFTATNDGYLFEDEDAEILIASIVGDDW